MFLLCFGRLSFLPWLPLDPGDFTGDLGICLGSGVMGMDAFSGIGEEGEEFGARFSYLRNVGERPFGVSGTFGKSGLGKDI